jgi:hypothetical protein
MLATGDQLFLALVHSVHDRAIKRDRQISTRRIRVNVKAEPASHTRGTSVGVGPERPLWHFPLIGEKRATRSLPRCLE